MKYSDIYKYKDGGKLKKDNTKVVINNGLPVKSLDELKKEQLMAADEKIKEVSQQYDKSLTATPTFYGGKEQNMSQYPMNSVQKLIYKSKEAAEADRQYNFGKALTNIISFVPGPVGYGANMASGAIDIAEGNEAPGAIQFIPNRVSKAVSGFNNLMTSKDLYDYGTTPEKTYPDMLPYYTDDYKRELLKPKSITSRKNGGVINYLKNNYYNKLKK